MQGALLPWKIRDHAHSRSSQVHDVDDYYNRIAAGGGGEQIIYSVFLVSFATFWLQFVGAD